ncbi:MAG: hypothetical protein JXD22_01110 [Sedimentisphaerales bacterium]|nr:hypothetical protein [Sedimentisphaerales bacterium]
MTPREIVKRTIRFKNPPRLAYDLPPEYANDFHWVGPDPNPDHRPLRGRDEWGAIWRNIGTSNHGEVKEYLTRFRTSITRKRVRTSITLTK